MATMETIGTVTEPFSGDYPIQYYAESRPNGRVAVVRRGPKGGTRVVAVYSHRDIATRIADRLQLATNQEV